MPVNFDGLRGDGSSGVALNDGSALFAPLGCSVQIGADSILNTLQHP